jgi:acetyltransferase
MRSPRAVMPLQDVGVAVRAVSPVDAEVLQAFVRGLSPASRYRRFMVAIRELPADMLLRFIEPAPGREAVLLATVADGSASGQVVGVAQYAAVADPSTCEFAVVVADAYQRRGLGRRLLVELGATAANAGIRRAYADVLADNYAMLGLA